MSAVTLLASNILHSVYAARALQDAALLDLYYGPVIASPGDVCTLLPRKVRETRIFGEVEGLPLRRLWSVEIASRSLGHLPVAIERRLEFARRALDRAVARQVGSAQIVHVHSTGLIKTAIRAKDRGAFFISDARALHPATTTYTDPLRGHLEGEFELADLIILNVHFS